jgi:hypothetical protein
MHARLIVPTFFSLIMLAIYAAAAPPAVRRWTDNKGRYSVEAEYVESNDEHVKLKKANGTTITVPVARLSDADRAYLKTLKPPNTQPFDSGGARPILAFPDAVTEPPAWNDANVPFDLAAFLQAPPPQENAAPLYLDALYEFAPTEMVDLLFPNLPQEELKKRYDAYRPISREQRRLEEEWEKNSQSVDPAAVDAWLANFDVGFEKLAAAQQRPKCMFQPGRSIHSLWPHVQAARQVFRVVTWRSRRDIQLGHLERPIQDLKMLLRLSRDLQVRGGLVAQLVAATLDRGSCDLVCTLLNRPDINTRQCDQLLALLIEHETTSVEGFIEGNRAEYINSRQALHDLQHRTGSFDPQVMRDELRIEGDVTSPIACIKVFTDLGGSNPQRMANVMARLQGALQSRAWQGGKMLSEEDYGKEVAALNKFYATILALAEQPDYRRHGKARVKAAEVLINETTLATFVIPAETAVFDLLNRRDRQLHGTQCLVALRRWQIEHKGAPPDLATMVKAAGLPRVPGDPYSGEPLRMAVLEGKPVIYSVGPDGKDDGAQIVWNEARNQPGDFIFRLEDKPANQ